MPEAFGDDASVLVDLVREVNENEVSPNERLSDKVQFYDSETHVLENAEKRQARLTLEKSAEKTSEKAAEKAHSGKDGNRRSLHDRLNANREAARANDALAPHKENTRSADVSL